MIITGVEQDDDLCALKARCLADLGFYTQTFFKLYTGRDFAVSQPIGRASHQKIIWHHLTDVFNLKTTFEWITIPPGHGKSTSLIYFITWCFAHYADCRFLYISYSHDLASEHTSTVKSIMKLPEYQQLFGVAIRGDSSAKDNFKTMQGGAVKAHGSQGSITGHDAGLPSVKRFSGCLIMDDMHKPDEVYSDTIRASVKNNYQGTIKTRRRSPRVPILGIGQGLHEDDLRAFVTSGKDGYPWKHLHLKCMDDAGNILAPEIFNLEMAKSEMEYNPDVWHAQYQGEPQPSGGGIFQIDNFYQLDKDPEMLITFITGDTAETAQDCNDESAFSFWGLYRINDTGRKFLDQYALHWIDCVHFRVEPADLEDKFFQFYSDCCMYKTPPTLAAIENKSTGVTLNSILKRIRGLSIRSIDRTKIDGNKITRFLSIQPYINKKLVSINQYARHKSDVLAHCAKITKNNTHRHDDIADTLFDAVKMGLMDKSLINTIHNPSNDIVKNISMSITREINLRSNLWT